MMELDGIVFNVSEPLSGTELAEFDRAMWPQDEPRDHRPVLARSLLYVTARADGRLVGFVNMAWDGGEHGFLLDTNVVPELRRSGIGTELVNRVVDETRKRGLKWVHVDFEPHLRHFYANCGFRRTEAGLIDLKGPAGTAAADL